MRTLKEHLCDYDQYAKVSGLFSEEEVIKAVTAFLIERYDALNSQGKQYWHSDKPDEMQACGGREALGKIIDELDNSKPTEAKKE